MNKYENEQDVLKELLKIKEKMKNNPEEYAKYMKAVKGLGAKLNGEQKKKLEQLIKLLE